MRKLMWFSIGFAVTCAAGIYLYCGNWLLLICLACAAAAAFTLASSFQKVKVVRLILLGCAAASLWVWIFDGIYLSPLRKLDGETVEAAVEVTDFSEYTERGITADGRIRLEGKSYRIRIYGYDMDNLMPGDLVEGPVRLRFTVGGKQEGTYHSGIGIFLLGYLDEDVAATHAEKIPFQYFPAVLKSKIKSLLESMFPTDTLPFAQALLLGDRTLLDYGTNTDLSISGIRHVVAVSGLHVSILFTVVYALFGYRRFVTPIVGWMILLVFAAVTGFTPSVVRACIMHGLMLGSLMAQKEYDPPTSLAFAVLVMLCANPMAVTSIGLQLSVACVVGILLFSPGIQNFILSDQCLGKASAKTKVGKLKRWIAGTVSVTISTLITTTPLCAIYFGTISLIGILTNLLTLWVVSVIFCGILLACVLGAVYIPAGSFVAWVISWLIRYVLLVAKTLASFPLAAVYTTSVYIVVWIIFCYILMVVFLAGKKKHPWILAGCVTAGLAAAVLASWLEPRLDNYRFTVLDVGQGQCILLQKDEHYYMVDCGGDLAEETADLAASTLLGQGVTNLDGVILTHYDEDHAGAVEQLLYRIPADTVYLPDIPDSGTVRKNLTAAYEDSICWIEPDSRHWIENMGITVFAGEANKTDNESSLCILFQPGNCDILITGDRGAPGERALLEQADLPDVEVLVVGHHGAKDAACLELLHAVQPEIAVISVGASNPYGHPSEAALERLALFWCRILRTDTDGTIMIRG